MTAAPGRAMRLGDAVRGLMVVCAAVLAAEGRQVDALAMLLALAGSVGARWLRPTRSADLLVCLTLLVAQGGAVAGLTSTTSWWDSVSHATTALLVTLILVSGERRVAPGLALLAALALGLVWEGLEWGTDLAVGTDFSPSLADTATDVGMDALGASIAFLALRLQPGRRRPGCQV